MTTETSITPEALRSYEKAGRIAAQALKFGAQQITPDASMRDMLDSVEEYIRKHGCGIAFPAQSSVNNIAAHYCPTDAEDIIYEEGMVVKLDVGAHHEGYIGDTATSVSIGGAHDELIKATQEALHAAESVLGPGVFTHDVGRAIGDAISAHGFLPIRNLSGHGLGKFRIHTTPSIPNYPSGERALLHEGMIVAVEPFATDGTTGLIYNSTNPTIFTLGTERPVRTPHARETLSLVKRYDRLPFTTRWLTRELGSKALLGLADLRRAGALVEYPPLPEKSGGNVAQSEHTFLITKNGCKVLTKDDD